MPVQCGTNLLFNGGEWRKGLGRRSASTGCSCLSLPRFPSGRAAHIALHCMEEGKHKAARVRSAPHLGSDGKSRASERDGTEQDPAGARPAGKHGSRKGRESCCRGGGWNTLHKESSAPCPAHGQKRLLLPEGIPHPRSHQTRGEQPALNRQRAAASS